MSEKARLDKILANMGIGSRKEVKQLVRKGFVFVNGNKIKDSSLRIRPETDEIIVNGEPVIYRKYVYIMLHKPPGVISATEDLRHRTVLDLIDRKYIPFAPFPVGRLDIDTEGLLLITNDGGLAHQLLSPRRQVPKTYYAEVQGKVNTEDVEQFRKGVTLDDGYVTLPAQLNVLSYDRSAEENLISNVKVTITEGKYHQVKRMFKAVGKAVQYLKRLEMGSLQLDESLSAGEYRELTEAELAQLQKVTTIQIG